MSDRFFVAQVGRTIGLHGDLKFHLHTDFPEQFKPGAIYQSSRGELQIQSVNLKRGIVRFVGYEGLDAAKALTNAKLYATLEQTKSACDLKEGEYFWFDIQGCNLYEGELCLGEVVDIQRLPQNDYLLVDTHSDLVAQGLPKSF